MCISVCISSISSWVFFSTQWTNSHSLVSLLTEWKGQREERDKRVVYKVIPSTGSTYRQHSHSLSVANGFTAVPHYSEQANTEREEHSSALVVRQNNHVIFSEVLKSLRQLSFEWTVLNRELMSHYRSEWDVSQLSTHGEHQLSFSLTLSIHYPPETRNMFWTWTALCSACAVPCGPDLLQLS